MFYPIKRYILFRIKELEDYFQTLKRQKEIAKAYHAPFKIKVSLSPQIIKFSLITIITIAVFAGIVSVRKPIIDYAISVKSKMTLAAEQRKIEAEKKQTKPKKVTKKIISQEAKPKKLKDTPASKTTPFVIPVTKMRYFLVANKARKEMFLLENSGTNWIIKNKYPVAIGKDTRRKSREGDLRTPEGQYFIVGRQEGNELNRIYGPLAYILNYPNEKDKKEGRTGTGIWIHGTAPDTVPFETKGCLEMDNSTLNSLGQILKRGIGTPVLIVSDSSLTDPVSAPDYASVLNHKEGVLKQYLNHKEALNEFLNEWSKAWSSREIEKYQVLYDKERFISRGMKWDEWMEYKQRTFENYTMIEIGINNFFLSDFSESTAVLKFVQSYKSNRLESVNGKKLTVIRREDGWKIFNETSIPKEELLL